MGGDDALGGLRHREVFATNHFSLQKAVLLMKFSYHGVYDWSDFNQDAEAKVLELEQNGLSFNTPEDRKRFINRVARNLTIDSYRMETNRKRLLKTHYQDPRNENRAEQIASTHQKVSKALKRLSFIQPNRLLNQNLTAKIIGTTMAVELIEWELEGVTHGEMACRVFKISNASSAHARKICRAMEIAKEEFRKACLES